MARRSTERVLRDEIAEAMKERDRAKKALELRSKEVEAALDARKKADEALADAIARLDRADRMLAVYLPLPIDPPNEILPAIVEEIVDPPVPKKAGAK